MRLLFIADGRSPTALNWMGYFLQRGDEVHLASTFLSDADVRLASFTLVPVAFSNLIKRKPSTHTTSYSTSRKSRRVGVTFRTAVRQWLGPLTLASARRQLQPVIERLQPDLVHAMRIPYEGMLACRSAEPSDRVLISVWGNDFTLHASSTPLMRLETRKALSRADALHADCQRDIRLAHAEGFSQDKPVVVLPGAGGVQSDIFYPPETPVKSPVVINPRGFRAYINNAAFFRAVPIILRGYPQAIILCPAMKDEPQAWRWVEELGITGNVRLLPRLTRPQMADLFRQARVAVSPALHDGTPNTLLEAMACGCLPVAGDLESLREWIVPGENGLLFDPNNPQDIARAILDALAHDDLQDRAREINLELISTRAEHESVMQAALDFYQRLIST